MSSASAEEKKRRAEERKARLLSKGGDRLARITGTGRGEDAKLFDTTSVPPPKKTSEVEAGGGFEAQSTSEDPAEVDISALGTGASTSSLPPPDLGDAFLGELLGAPTGPSGVGPGAGGLGGLSNMMGMPTGAEATAAAAAFQHKPPSFLERILPLVQFVGMITLGIWAVFFRESEVNSGVSGGEGVVGRWGSLRWRPPSNIIPGVSSLPLFYFFTTLELMLQSMRIAMIRHRPAPPTMLSSITPHLPPQIALALNTGSKYWALLSSLIDDLAVLVFIVGLRITYDSLGTSASNDDDTR